MSRESPGGAGRVGILLDLALSTAALGAWEIRFGSLGPNFNADAAVHAGMVLRPIDASFVYFWGQGRLGSVVPLIGKLVHGFPGVGAAESAQLSAYLCSAVALLLMLGLLRSLPAKLLCFTLFAFPPGELAEAFLSAGQPSCALVLFSLLEVGGLLRVIVAPTLLHGVWLGLAAGALLWAGEPGLILLVAQLPLLVSFALRTPSSTVRRAASGVIGGLVLPAAVILVGKWHLSEGVDYRRLLHPGAIWRSLLHLGPAVRPLASIFGTFGLLSIAAATGLLALRAVLRWKRLGGWPPPLAAIGLAPVLGFVVIAASRWFEMNERAPRYLAYPTLLTLVSLALAIDALELEAPRWLGRAGAVAMLGIAVVAGVVNVRGGAARANEGPRWVARTRWIQSIGCRSVIAGYSDSYPYYALSEGFVPATPNEQAYVRNPELALEAVHVPLVCVLPWWSPEEACPPTLKQFGTSLRFGDELIGHVSVGPQPDEQPLRVCRYVPAA